MASTTLRLTPRSVALHIHRNRAHCIPVTFKRLQTQLQEFHVATTSSKQEQTQDVVHQPEVSTHPTRKIKVEEYLDQLAATKTTLTLEDVEHYRPKSHATPGTPEYEANYHQVIGTLTRSFTSKQLLEAIDLYGIERPRRRTKRSYAMTIMERRWDWPSLADLQRRQKDNTEVVTTTFPLNARQSFHILGPDGSNLLSLSTKYNVRISLSADPLALRVEGVRGSLHQLGEELRALKESVVTETFHLPIPQTLDSRYLQRISRISGAFVESVRDGIVQISYKDADTQAADRAKRLAAQVIMEDSADKGMLLSVPRKDEALEGPTPYSLYPFFSNKHLHWNMNSTNLFRLRRVGNWLSEMGSGGDRAGISDSGIYSTEGNPFNIRTWLSSLESASLGSHSRRKALVASFGHLLFHSRNHASPLIPPVQGALPWEELRPWIHSHQTSRIFCPSAPVSARHEFTNALQTCQRLVYRSSQPSSQENTIEFEITRPEIQDSDPHLELSKALDPASETLGVQVQSKCWIGHVHSLELLLPDRPMDLQLSVKDGNTLTSRTAYPESLQEYLNRWQAWVEEGLASRSPQPPLHISHSGVLYILSSYGTIHQNAQATSLSPTSGGETLSVLEHVSDLSSDQMYSECKVFCEDAALDSSVANFLQECDRLNTQRKLRTSADILENLFRA